MNLGARISRLEQRRHVAGRHIWTVIGPQVRPDDWAETLGLKIGPGDMVIYIRKPEAERVELLSCKAAK